MQSSTARAPSVSKEATIWLVDDSPTQLAFARHLLLPVGEAVCLTDGESVLERLRDERPDLIVLDWNLPRASGLDVCREVRRRFDSAALPVLVLTTDDQLETVVVALEAGANDYVRKPPRQAELVARVRALLRTKQLYDALQIAQSTAEVASRAKDEFIGFVTHELRTPLHSILGWSQLLLTGELSTEKQRRAIETISRNAKQQSSLIEELMDTTRIAVGKLSVERLRVDLATLVGSSIESLRPTADQKGVRLVAHVGRNVFANADPGRFQQVASNLISNAIKFSERDAEVRVDLAEQGSWAELTVADEGRGIDLAFLPHVFDRFKQERRKGRGDGLGLGLAIVKSLVNLHDGSVEARSEGIGKGATFVVRIPLDVGELPEPIAATELR